ncbi:hypothetical protein Tco_1040553 [Tanacetum coccineum]
MEILAGQKSVELANVALRKIRNGKIEEVMDPILYYHKQPLYRKEQMGIVADVGTRCLLFGGNWRMGMNDVARELVHVTKESIDHVCNRRGHAGLEEMFSNSSLLQMISLSPDSIYAMEKEDAFLVDYVEGGLCVDYTDAIIGGRCNSGSDKDKG